MRPISKLLAATAITVCSFSGNAIAADTINLKYHSPFGKAGINEASRVWMDEVEKRTKGQVKFTRIFGGPLGKLSGQPTGVKAGSFDVGQVSAVYNPGVYPKGSVSTLPFLSKNVPAHNLAVHEMFQSPDFEAEFDSLNQKYLFNGTWISIEMLTYENLQTLADLKKVKIRAHGGSAHALTAAGITSYAIPFGELPAAAERKVVEAATMGAPTDAVDFGFGDIFKYWYGDMPWNFMPMTLVMNKESWNKLPADVQQVIEELNEEMVTKTMELVMAQEKRAESSLTGELGVQNVNFAEQDKLEAAGKASWEIWKKEMAEKGINGDELLETYFSLMKKHGA